MAGIDRCRVVVLRSRSRISYGRVRSDWLAQSEAESSFFGLVAVFHTAENENGGRKNTSSFVFFRSAPNVSAKKKNEGKPIG